MCIKKLIMNAKKREVLNSLDEYFQDSEQRIENLQNELAKVKLERDMYKGMLDSKHNPLSYMVIHRCDNGEGVDTETCVGVFTTRSLAARAVLDVCKKNEDVSFDDFLITEFFVGKTLMPGEIVQVEKHDEEAHCEVSTTIIGIRCDSDVGDDNYIEAFVVDTVYYIEWD